jgi:CheY-like chemotaxis protein
MDGMEALAYLESCDTIPDLILLDIMMPGLNGYQVQLNERVFGV